MTDVVVNREEKPKNKLDDDDTADMCPRCFTIVPPDAKVCPNPKCREKICHNC